MPERPALAELAAEQHGEAFLILVFRHVESEEAFLAKQVAGERQRDFCFPHARRAEEKKAPARTTGFAQAEFAALEQRGDPRNDVILSANALPQMVLQFAEFGARCIIVVGRIGHAASPPSSL